MVDFFLLRELVSYKKKPMLPATRSYTVWLDREELRARFNEDVLVKTPEELKQIYGKAKPWFVTSDCPPVAEFTTRWTDESGRHYMYLGPRLLAVQIRVRKGDPLLEPLSVAFTEFPTIGEELNLIEYGGGNSFKIVVELVVRQENRTTIALVTTGRVLPKHDLIRI